MREETKEKLYSGIVLALVLAALTTGLVQVAPVFRRYCELKRQVRDREERKAETERRIAEIGEKRRRFATDREFVESIARQNRRVYPGEIVFVFEDGESATKR